MDEERPPARSGTPVTTSKRLKTSRTNTRDEPLLIQKHPVLLPAALASLLANSASIERLIQLTSEPIEYDRVDADETYDYDQRLAALEAIVAENKTSNLKVSEEFSALKRTLSQRDEQINTLNNDIKAQNSVISAQNEKIALLENNVDTLINANILRACQQAKAQEEEEEQEEEQGDTSKDKGKKRQRE